MPLFFIEMGQGIIARPELRVTTSCLHSCTLIAGYNRASGYGGAYHYPSDKETDSVVLRNMDTWVAILRPTHVTLVFAKNPVYPMMGQQLNTSHADVAFLHRWVRQSCNTDPAVDSAVAAGVLVGVAVFAAGNIGHLPGEFEAGKIAVDHLHAGTYMLNPTYRYTVVGENLENG
jgi:hypothetical protein